MKLRIMCLELSMIQHLSVATALFQLRTPIRAVPEAYVKSLDTTGYKTPCLLPCLLVNNPAQSFPVHND